MHCPNVKSPEWKSLVEKVGEIQAWREFFKYGDIPKTPGILKSIRTRSTEEIAKGISDDLIRNDKEIKYTRFIQSLVLNKLGDISPTKPLQMKPSEAFASAKESFGKAIANIDTFLNTISSPELFNVLKSSPERFKIATSRSNLQNVSTFDDVLKAREQYQYIVDNFEKLKEFAIVELAHTGLLLKKDKVVAVDSTDVTNDSVDENDDNTLSAEEMNAQKFNATSFEVNYRDSASPRVRALVQTIKTGEYELGIPLYANPNDVMVDMMYAGSQMNLSGFTDSNTKLNAFVAALGSRKEGRPYLNDLLEKIIGKNGYVETGQWDKINDILTFTTKAYANESLLLYKLRKQGGEISGVSAVKTIGSNRDEIKDQVSRDWLAQHKNSDFFKKGPTGEYLPKTDKVKQLNTIRQEGVKLSGFDQQNKFKEFFKVLGIDFTTDDVSYISTRLSKALRQGKGFEVVFQDKGMLDNIYNSFLKNINVPFKDHYGFQDEKRSMHAMAQLYYDANPGRWNVVSSRTADGKSKYLYIQPNYLEVVKREWENSDGKSLINSALARPNAEFWNKVKNNIYKFTPSYFSGSREQEAGKNGKVRKDFTEKEQLVTMFLKHQENMNEGTYIIFNLSDKTTTAEVKMTKEFFQDGRDVPVGKGVEYTIQNNKIEYTPAMKDKIYNSFVEPEISRILAAIKFEKDVNLENFVTSSKLFYFMPKLNSDPSLEEFRQKLYSGNVSMEQLKGEYADAIAESVLDDITNSASLQIGKYINNRIFKVEDDGQFSFPLFRNGFADTDYVERFRKTGATGRTLALLMVMDMKLNYMNAQVKTVQYLKFDPMIAFKAFKGFKKEAFENISLEDRVKLVNSTWDEFSKRAASIIAPGAQGNWHWTIGGKDYGSSTYRAVTGADVVMDNKHFKGMEITDAQEFVTLQEHIDHLMSGGKLDSAIWKSIHNKITDAGPGGYYQLSGVETKALFSATKPVYVGAGKEGPDEAGLNRIDYVKSSRYPLIPSHEVGSERDKLRIWMEKNNIQTLNFASGKKMGRPGKSVTLFDVNGKFIEPSAADLAQSLQTLSRDSLRTQQEIPHQHDTIATITQMNRTLFDGLLDNKFNIAGMKNISGQEAKDLKEAVRARMFDLKARELRDEIGNLNRSHKGIQRLLLQVMKEDTTGSYTENDMRALELNSQGFFRVALESQFKGKKLQGLINSMINKNVMLKTDGASFIQVSAVGAKYNFSSLSKGVKSEIIWTKNYAKNFKNGNVGLDYIKLDPQTKKVTAAQVIVSQYLRDEKGNIIDLADFITEKNGVKILDTSQFSPEMFQLVASRIPNQSLVSTLPLEVVGFLPSYMENIVIVPDGITGQMGSDFDVDKLYTYIPKMVKAEDGKYKGIPYELNMPEDIYNMDEDQLNKLYRDIHWEVLTQTDTFGAITKTVDNPEVKEKIKERDLAMGKYGITLEKNANLPLDFNTTIKRYNDNRSGKSGVSIYASLVSAQADMQDKILRLGTIDGEGKEQLTPITIKLTPDGKPINLGFVGRTGSSVSFLGEVRTISDNINMQFTEAVDNAKNQFLHEFNWDSRTMPAMGFFSMLSAESGQSVPIEMVMELTSQRSIEKLLEGADMKQDSFGDFDLQAIKTTIVELQDKLINKINDGVLLTNAQQASEYLEDEFRDKALDPITLRNMWLVGKAMYDGGGIAEMKSLAISKSNKPGKLEKIAKDLGFPSVDDMLLKYYTVQYDALNLFFRLEDMGRELMTILGSVYTYTKGIGKDVFHTKQKLHQLNKLAGSGNFLGIENMAGLITKDEHGFMHIVPKGEIGASIENSLINAQSVHQNLFPISTGKTMETLVQRLLDNWGRKLESLGKQSYYDFFNNTFTAVRSYMYTIPELELFDNVSVLRNKLINGETSIGNRILELRKDPVMVKNGFLKNLDVDVSYNGTYVLDFKAPFGTDLDEKVITSGFYELVKSENEDIRQLAKDLAIYPYATGDAGNMGRFIPVEYYFSDKDFSVAIHQLSEFFVSHLASDPENTNILMDQIVQNDPGSHARKFYYASSDMSESTFKKILKPLIGNADSLENVKGFTVKVGDFSAHKKGDSLARAFQVPLSDREVEAAEIAGLEPFTLNAKGEKVAKSKYPPYILINDSFTGMYTSDSDRSNNYLYKRVSPALNAEGTGVYERINILGYKNIKEFEYDNPGLKSAIKDNAVEVNDVIMLPEVERPEIVNTISSNDKVVFGHPGIGKTYLKESGRKGIIDFDTDYKSKINEKFNLPKGFKARNDFQKSNKEEYQKAVRELWIEAKQEAKSTGKQLFASDMILLREFANDFDKVITMSKDTFVDRAKQRNDYTEGETEKWKDSLDVAISKVDSNKIITTDKYLSDLLEPEEIYTDIRQEISEKLPSIVKETAKKHLPKELFKTRQATQFIGDGGNTDSTTNRIKILYSEYGLANTGVYNSDDVVMVASNGARSGAFSPVVNGELQGAYKNIDLAIAAGARIIMDTAAHLESSKKYNIGEWALAEYMTAHGYEREDLTGMWTPKEPIKSEIVEDGKVTKGINISSYETGLGGKLTNFAKMPVEFRGKKYSSAEEAYQQNKGKDLSDDAVRDLMIDVLIAKLEQHPELVAEITTRGGTSFLAQSSHNLIKNGRTIKEDRWTGKDGLFMESLRVAYAAAVTPKEEILGPVIQSASVTYKDTNFIVEGDETEERKVYYTNIDGQKGKELVDKNMLNKVLLAHSVSLHPDWVVTLTDMQHKPSYFVTEVGEVLSLNPSTYGKQITSDDVVERVRQQQQINEEAGDENTTASEPVTGPKGKTIFVPEGSSPTNMPIKEDEKGIYLMNDGQQEAFDHIKKTVQDLLKTRKRVTSADFANTIKFNDPLTEKFSGLIPQVMWENMIGLAGRGGVGKTTVIKAIVEAIESSNKYSRASVMYLAPTHTAATVLQEALGLDSEKANDGTVNTTASHLRKRPVGKAGKFDLIDNVSYKASWAYKPAFGDPDVIIIDESSMIGKEDILDMLIRLKVDLDEKRITRMPIFIFMGDYRQLGPINEEQNHYVNKGVISATLLSDKTKTKELTQVMRSDNKFLHQVFDAVGEQIVKNMDRTRAGEQPVDPSFAKYDALTTKSSPSVLIVNNPDGVVDDYAEYLATNNNPYGMFWVHYNNVNHPLTKSIAEKIRKTYFQKAGLVLGSEQHRAFAKGDYIEFSGGTEAATKPYDYVPTTAEIKKLLVDRKHRHNADGKSYKITEGIVKPRARFKVIDIVTDNMLLTDMLPGKLVPYIIDKEKTVEVERIILYNRQNKIRAMNKVLGLSIGPVDYSGNYGVYNAKTKQQEGIQIKEMATGKILANISLRYSDYKNLKESNLLNELDGTSTMPFVTSYIGSSHTAQGNSIKNVIVGDYNVKGAGANSQTNRDDIFSSLYVSLTRTSGTLTIIKSPGFNLVNNQDEYMGAITDDNNMVRPVSSIQPYTEVDEDIFEEEKISIEEDSDVFDLEAWARRSQQDGVVEELFGGSPDSKTILNRVYQNTSEANKQILMLVGKSPFISSVNIEIDETITDPGEYHPNTKTIKINPKEVFGADFTGDIEDARTMLHEVVLHELLHHATSDFLNANPASLNAEQKKWVVALKVMFGKVQTKILNDPAHKAALTAAIEAMSSGKGLISQKDKNLYYGLTNVNEFVSMIMSNKEFREFMNNTPYDGPKSILERFMDILMKILESLGIQVKEGSVLKEAVTNIVGLVNSRTENDSFEAFPNPIKSTSAKEKLVSDNLSKIIETLNIQQIC